MEQNSKTLTTYFIDAARILVLVLIVFFIAMGVQTSEAFSLKSMTLKFVQISDAHISSNPDTSYKILSDSKDLLSDAIKQTNEIKDLDFVMFTGDMVNEPTVENYKDFFNLLGELKFPSLMVFGNHDYAAEGAEGLSKSEALGLIQKHNPNYTFDKSYYAFSPKKDYRIIALDLSIKDKTTANGYLTDEQLSFLANELETHSDKVVVIFQHFPVVEPFVSEHHKVLNSDAYLSILEKYKNPILVVSGHYHTTKITKKNNIIHVSSPSLVTFPDAFRVISITNYNDRAVFDFCFNETRLTEAQQKSRALTMVPNTLLGVEKDRVVSFTVMKKMDAKAQSGTRSKSEEETQVQETEQTQEQEI